jgi:hypothetical protein
MTPEEVKLYKAIDEILYSDWNPIGVVDLPRNEYQGYDYKIFELKTSGSNVETIAEALYNLEIERMGLTGNLEHCRNSVSRIPECSGLLIVSDTYTSSSIIQ